VGIGIKKPGAYDGVVNCGWFLAAAGQQGTTVVVTAPTVMVGGGSLGYGYQPARTNCPHCHADIVTNIEYRSGTLTWLICGIILLVGLGLWYVCILLQLQNWLRDQ